MKHGIKQCSCGKRISQCRCPGPRLADGSREPKPIIVIKNGCSDCSTPPETLKRRAPGDAVAEEQAKIVADERAKQAAEEKAKFDEFLAKVKALGIYYETQHYEFGKTTKTAPFVESRWVTGGVSGGSCWDTGDENPHYPLEGEPEPEFDAFDKIIEELAPNIGFVQYKRLCREVIERSSKQVNEYYGNHTTYGVKRFFLKKLYDELVDKGLYVP